MIATSSAMYIVLALGCLALAVRGLQGQRLGFERSAAMIVAWVVIIAGLAFAIDRFLA
jgi:hypothetical protein